MDKYKILGQDLITVGEARKILGLASRSTVGFHIDTGKIKYVWINEGKTTALRLLLKSDVLKLK